jgi:hypothetical protein
MLHSYPAEYAGPVVVGPNRWVIHKFCGFHSSWLAEYHIKITTDFGPPEFVCTCQAGRGCKHIQMVAEFLAPPKKDLF